MEDFSSGLQTRVGIVKVGEGGNGGAGGGEIGGGNEKNQKGNGGGAGLRNGKVANKGKGDTIDGGYGVDLNGKQAGSDNEVRSRGDNGGDGANFGGGGGGPKKEWSRWSWWKWCCKDCLGIYRKE